MTGIKMTPRALLLELAAYHGIGEEVAALLQDRPDPLPKSLATLLSTTRARTASTILATFQRSGVARSQISFYESGLQKNPGVRTIQALSYGYRLPFAQVLAAIMHDAPAFKPPAPGALEAAVEEVRKRRRITSLPKVVN